MKKILFPFLLIFITACASLTVKQDTYETIHFKNKNIFTILNQKLTVEDSPEIFENSIPDSQLILNSITLFQKKYKKLLISDNVTDFTVGNNEIIILKKDKVRLINNKCNSFLIEPENFYPEHVVYSDNLIALTGKRIIKIFNLSLCGEILTLNRKWKHFLFNSKYYFFSNGKNFEIFKYGDFIPVMRGTFANRFIAGNITNNNIKILDSKGQILFFNLEKLNLDKVIKTGYSAENGVVFNRYFIFSHNENSLFFQGKKFPVNTKHIIFSKNSPSVFNSGKFFLLQQKKTIPYNDNISSFAIKNNLIFFQKKHSLYVMGTKKRFVKTILFKKPFILCSCDNSSLGFTDFNGIKKRILLNKKNCKDCKYNHGKFLNKQGKTLYNFSMKISTKKNITMYKRIVGENIYYYFEKN